MGKCGLTHILQDTTLKEAGVNYWFLLPRLQRIGKETFLVSIHTVLELIRQHVDYGEIYKDSILSRSGSLKWTAYLKQIQILLTLLGSAHLGQAFP